MFAFDPKRTFGPEDYRHANDGRTPFRWSQSGLLPSHASALPKLHRQTTRQPARRKRRPSVEGGASFLGAAGFHQPPATHSLTSGDVECVAEIMRLHNVHLH